MITLIVGLAQSTDADRAREYDLCLARNISNRRIDRVILIEEEPGSRSVKSWTGSEKVSVVALNARAHYQDHIEIANELGGVAILANADVHFDWSVERLSHIPREVLCAITRTDYLDNLWSSDAWAFRPKLAVTGCDWALGRSGCETAFCEQVERQLGWKVWNPCYSVRLCHVHESGVRPSEHDRCVPYASPPKPTVVLFNGATASFLGQP